MFILQGHSQFGLVGLIWQVFESRNEPDGVRLQFSIHSGQSIPSQQNLLMMAQDFIDKHKIEWMKPVDDAWEVDLANVRKMLHHDHFAWLTGVRRVIPEFRIDQQLRRPLRSAPPELYFSVVATVQLFEHQDDSQMSTSRIPPEITDSLKWFRADHPDPKKVAFIVMKFGSDPHSEIAATIKTTLASMGLVGLRADDKHYHPDLLWNVLTYIYGCHAGIAVYERIQSDVENANVGLEVGYLMGIGKNVCLLKDDTLARLQTDLIGRLYLPFDTRKLAETLPPVLRKWLKDIWGVVPEPRQRDQGGKLSNDSRQLLLAAASSDGEICTFADLNGTSIQVGSRQFTDGSARSEARWSEAISDLIKAEMATSVNEKITKLTKAGFEASDQLKE